MTSVTDGGHSGSEGQKDRFNESVISRETRQLSTEINESRCIHSPLPCVVIFFLLFTMRGRLKRRNKNNDFVFFVPHQLKRFAYSSITERAHLNKTRSQRKEE